MGPKDVKAGNVLAVRRDTGDKVSIEVNTVSNGVGQLLDSIHEDMLLKARKERDAQLKVVFNWNDFVAALDNKSLCLTPWCETPACEDAIRERSKRQ